MNSFDILSLSFSYNHINIIPLHSSRNPTNTPSFLIPHLFYSLQISCPPQQFLAILRNFVSEFIL